MTLYIHHRGVRCFPKDIFPKGNFQTTISQVATSQLYNLPSGIFPKVRLGRLRRRRLHWGRALLLGQTWEVAALKIANLGSCRLRKYLWGVAAWENTFGELPLEKIPLGSCRLRKYLWRVATWEKAEKRVPYISIEPLFLFSHLFLQAKKSKTRKIGMICNDGTR